MPRLRLLLGTAVVVLTVLLCASGAQAALFPGILHTLDGDDEPPAEVVTTCDPVSTTTARHEATDLALACTTTGEDPLVYAVPDQVDHGTLSAPDAQGHVTFTPDGTFVGDVSFQYGAGTADPATATIHVTNPAAPSCDAVGAQQAIVGSPITIQTACTDADGDTLTLGVTDGPDHGTATVAGSKITYTATDAGADGFRFHATDGDKTSTSVPVQIAVGSGAPVCAARSTSVLHGKPVQVALTCDSPAAEGLTYTATDGAHGTVTVNRYTATYTSDVGFAGRDSFTYTATGAHGADTQTVTVDVTNTAPSCADVAQQQAIVGLPIAIATSCTDGDGDTLTLEVYDGPDHGSASVNGSSITYTATGAGTDTFSFRADDGAATSAGTLVRITVGSGAPVCGAKSTTTLHDKPVQTDLTCSSSANEHLTYDATDGAHGTVTVNGATATYKPAAGFAGPDSFSYTATGAHGSDTKTVTITVTNAVPACDDVDAPATVGGVAVTVNVAGACTDGDGDTLTIGDGTGPDHGTVTRNGTRFTYTPDAAYAGTDDFTFTASDGVASPVTAKVTIVVASGVATCPDVDGLETHQGDPLAYTVKCTSPRGAPLTYAVTTVTGGTAIVVNSRITFTPTAGFVGTAKVKYTAADHGTTSAPGTLTIAVTDLAPQCVQPAAPTAMGGVAQAIQVSCSDADGDPIALQLVNGPTGDGSVAVSGLKLTYTADKLFAGTDRFTFRGFDGALDTGTIVVTIKTAPQLFVDITPAACNDTRTLVNAVETATPVCSIKRALALAPGGSTVTVRKGTYSETTIAGVNKPDTVWIQPKAGERPILKNLTVASSNRIGVRGFDIQYSMVRGSSNIAYENNDVTAGGLWAEDSSGLRYRNNKVHDANDGFVIETSKDVELTGNDLRKIPTAKRKEYGDGMQFVDVDGLLISGNTWDQFRSIPHSDAIELLSHNDDVSIVNNVFHKVRGPIATAGTGLTKTTNARWVIANNEFLGTYNWALQILNAPGIKILNNTAWNTGKGFQLSGPNNAGAIVANNITNALTVAVPGNLAYEDYNLITSGYRKGTHDIAKAPQFVSASSNVHLKATSPGVDAGIASWAMPLDAAGRGRFDAPLANTGAGTPNYVDMGAYEYGS